MSYFAWNPGPEPRQGPTRPTACRSVPGCPAQAVCRASHAIRVHSMSWERGGGCVQGTEPLGFRPRCLATVCGHTFFQQWEIWVQMRGPARLTSDFKTLEGFAGGFPPTSHCFLAGLAAFSLLVFSHALGDHSHVAGTFQCEGEILPAAPEVEFHPPPWLRKTRRRKLKV